MQSSLFICLYGAIIGFIAVYLPILILRLSRKKELFIRQICSSLIETADLNEAIHKKVENGEFDAELEGMIDRKLDDLVLVFKRQIPMASTFLTGTLVVKLKASAKEEIVKMIPEIKEKLLLRISRDFNPNQLIEDRIQHLDFSLLDRYSIIYAFVGAFIGLVLGMVQLAIMPLFS